MENIKGNEFTYDIFGKSWRHPSSQIAVASHPTLSPLINYCERSPAMASLALNNQGLAKVRAFPMLPQPLPDVFSVDYGCLTFL
jgi:hypothetical protein